MTDESIAGIPCKIEIKYYPKHYGAMDGCMQIEPEEPAHNEIVGVFKHDGTGKRMQWLEDKMTDEERERIERAG